MSDVYSSSDSDSESKNELSHVDTGLESDSESDSESEAGSILVHEEVSNELFDEILAEDITSEIFYSHNFSKKQLMDILYHGDFSNNWEDFIRQPAFQEFDLDDLSSVIFECCPDSDPFWEHPNVTSEISAAPSVLIEFLESYPELLSRFEENDFYGCRAQLIQDPFFVETLELVKS